MYHEEQDVETNEKVKVLVPLTDVWVDTIVQGALATVDV